MLQMTTFVRTAAVLKGVCRKIFYLYFFHDTNSSRPLKKQTDIFGLEVRKPWLRGVPSHRQNCTVCRLTICNETPRFIPQICFVYP